MVTAKRSPVLRAGAEFDFSALLAYVPDLSGEEEDITAELSAAFVAAYASSATDVAINTTVRDAAAKWARTRAGDLISDITEATRDRVRELVAHAVEQGLSPQSLARSIRDDAVFGKERAETVSVTETAFALGQGQRTAAEDQGQDERSWISEADACDACSANTDDGWISLDDDYSSGDNSIPQHPRCLPGDSLVAPIGEVAASSDRWYEGDLVIINTASGKRLSCTPNHPILTPTGWVGAGLLNVGDDVVSTGTGEWERRSQHDSEDMPARIEDVAKAVGCSKSGATAPVPVSPIDFHGDGGGSEVAIIRTNGLLRDGDEAPLSEQFPQGQLGLADVEAPLLDGERVATLLLKRAYPPGGGSMGGSDLSRSLFGAHSLPFERLGVAGAPQRYPSFLQAVGDSGARNADALRDRQYGLTSFVGSDQRGHIHADAAVQIRPALRRLNAGQPQGVTEAGATDVQFQSDVIHRSAGAVFADEVVHIERLPFRGHVYNLQTTSGMYIAEGIVTHNCRCTEIYRTKRVHEDDGEDDEKAATVPLVKEAYCPHCTRWVGRNIPVGSEVYCPVHKAVIIGATA